MSSRSQHWIAPGLFAELRDPVKGRGIYTTRPLKAGEVVAVWGGEIMTRSELALLPKSRQIHALQVEDDFYLVPQYREEAEVADLFNHCCDPNIGIQGQLVLATMRDIDAGEELSFDYATTDASDYDEFPCNCGAVNCRKVVRGDDWQKPELQERYKGWFSPYIDKRIKKLRQSQEH